MKLYLYPLLVASAALLLAACGDDDNDNDVGAPPAAPNGEIGSVDVIGLWGADEIESWEAMVAPWTAQTGGTMNFTGTRDITAILTTRVEGGNPPDVAIPAEIGLFQQFAREGQLVPLSDCTGLEQKIRDEYPQAFVDLGTVDGVLYGFFMKADTKGTIFYNPRLFEENGWEPLGPNDTWDDLVALTDQIRESGVVAPWSMGMEANGGTGFPGSDWIQQILLNEHDPEITDGIIDGTTPFTDSAMRDAWEKFGEIALTQGNVVQGGASAINATNFVDSTYPPFESPPRAAMVYMGGFASGFITEQFPDHVAGEDFDFFTWPGGGVTGGANIVYAFNSDPTTCSFLEAIAGAETQQVWVERGGFTSLNQNVSMNAYPDDVARAQAEQLLEADVFRFDLDDAIGGAVQSAVFQGVTSYLSNPGQLDSILENIEAARTR